MANAAPDYCKLARDYPVITLDLLEHSRNLERSRNVEVRLERRRGEAAAGTYGASTHVK